MLVDAWLSEMLGYPVYEVLDAKDTNLAIRKHHQTRSLTYAKVPVQDVATVADLTWKHGFRVVDVNVQFGGHGRPEAIQFGGVVLADPSHHSTLLKIAESCFHVSRFHQDSLTLPQANLIKREWLRNCLEGRRGLEVMVAIIAGEPVGFLAVRQEGNARVVDLLGVTEEYWGQGVGLRLMNAFVGWNGERELSAGTSLANVAAMRLYEGRGFMMRSASYVLHLHRGVQ